jgi:hypothetical protein
MIQLPKDIWNYIYEFDSTYRIIYNSTIEELLDVTSMWKLYFHHQDLMYNFKTKRMMTIKQAKSLSFYWNNQFLKSNSNRSYKRYYDKRMGFCSPVHISDDLPLATYYNRLKANIETASIKNKWKKNKISNIDV